MAQYAVEGLLQRIPRCSSVEQRTSLYNELFEYASLYWATLSATDFRMNRQCICKALGEKCWTIQQMLDDSLAADLPSQKYFGAMERVLMDSALQLTDAAREALAGKYAEFAQSCKAAIDDANQADRAVRAIHVWKILVRLLAKVGTPISTFTKETLRTWSRRTRLQADCARLCATRSRLRETRWLRPPLAPGKCSRTLSPLILTGDPTTIQVSGNAQQLSSITTSEYRDGKVEYLMRALRYVASRTSLAVDIFDAWWHLCEVLGQHLSHAFDTVGIVHFIPCISLPLQVAHELLRFCVGGVFTFLPRTSTMSELIERATQTVGHDSQLLAVMTAGISEQYVTRTWTRVPVLSTKLGECLTGLLSFDHSTMSESARHAQSRVLRDHSLFLIQCIRFYALKSPEDGEFACCNHPHAHCLQMP